MSKARIGFPRVLKHIGQMDETVTSFVQMKKHEDKAIRIVVFSFPPTPTSVQRKKK
jgi:hypothetical protein